ncbi:MAG: CoB--CoM heterodisulfide reductase iron-sulfur subunit B family protein [Planctomycetes bacterium]|nr:CoB--CoM heterodisulfide reductase iron-sulfur subunit B family protein [Planctomycetota bacterium]
MGADKSSGKLKKIPYYPGCSLKTKSKDFEKSAVAAARILGIELIELPKWNCCGTVFSLAQDDLMHHVAPLRNLLRVQEMNEAGLLEGENRLLTICPMCFNTLKKANQRMRDNPADLETINTFMDAEQDYQGEVEVIHLLELLKERGVAEIKAKVKIPLTALKVAPYYGCMLLRPKDIAIDDPEDPTIQEELLAAIGAQVVENPYKKVCCGSYQTVRNKYTVADLTYDILTHAKKAGAEMITTSCPLCAFNLDDRQKEVTEKYPDFEGIPVCCISQLMLLAFGVNRGGDGFELNYVDPRPLLKRKNLLSGADLKTGAK